MKDNALKIIFTLFVVAIVILSAFVINFYINFEASAKDSDSELFVKIFADVEDGVVPLNVNFSSIVMYNKGEVKYHWEFGDGESSEETLPSHNYSNNGSYICSLKVIDEDKKESYDSIEIKARKNLAPTGSFNIDPLTSSRPYVSLIPELSTTYAERFVANLIDSPIPTPRISSLDGWVTCEADFTDPEGDEITSYTWIIQPPSYTQNIFLGGENVQPKYKFEEQKVTLPGFVTYRQGDYKVTLIVEDSKGNNATFYPEFKIDISNERSKILGAKAQYKATKDLWLKSLSKKAFFVLAVNTLLEKFEQITGIPLIKTIILIILDLELNIKPQNVTYVELLAEFLEDHPFLENTVDNIITGIQGKLKNETSIDKLEQIREDLSLGDSNKRPVIKDELPEHKSINLPVKLNSTISVFIDDLHMKEGNITEGENNTFNVTIYDKNGYLEEKTWINVKSNRFETKFIEIPPSYSKVQWVVEVVDFQGDKVKEEFWFTTFS